MPAHICEDVFTSDYYIWLEVKTAMSKVKILVVEDEAIIAYNLCDTLNSFDYDAGEPALTYDEAIEIIDHEKSHLAILDIQLATKKTGIDLGMVIHKKHDFPFIYLTSNSDKSTFDDATFIPFRACFRSTFVVKCTTYENS
jgi:CheY-like chemotaxis protein